MSKRCSVPGCENTIEEQQMSTWVLIIWMLSGGNSIPTRPVVVSNYNSKAECEEAAEVWRALKNAPFWAAERAVPPAAVCLPGKK
jgi:hypothetical protein